MKIYVGIQTPQMQIIRISDSRKLVEEALAAIDKKDGSCQFHIIESENVCKFTSSFTASLSMNYEMDCVEETVRTRLTEKGVDVDSAEAQPLIDDITSDAFHDINHYDIDEDYAIDEALKEHASEIDALVQGEQK